MPCIRRIRCNDWSQVRARDLATTELSIEVFMQVRLLTLDVSLACFSTPVIDTFGELVSLQFSGGNPLLPNLNEIVERCAQHTHGNCGHTMLHRDHFYGSFSPNRLVVLHSAHALGTWYPRTTGNWGRTTMLELCCNLEAGGLWLLR